VLIKSASGLRKYEILGAAVTVAIPRGVGVESGFATDFRVGGVLDVEENE
jgi:hypothetical protein